MAKIVKIWDKYGVLLLIAIEIVVFTIGNPKFISTYTLLNVLRQGSTLCIAALGYGLCVISGVLNLSIGAIMSLAAVSACALSTNGVPPILVIIIIILMCVVCSLIDNTLSFLLEIDPFLMTLATMNIWSGLSYTITQGKTVHISGKVYEFIGSAKIFGVIPFIFIILIVCFLVANYITTYTQIGRDVYAIGGNAAAAFLNGINVVKVRLFAAALGGAFMGISTVVLLSRNLVATANLCGTVYIDCLTGVVLGGVSLYGGSGKMHNILLGVLVLQLLNIGLQMMGISSWTVTIIKGLLLIVSFTIDYLRTRTKESLLLSREVGC